MRKKIIKISIAAAVCAALAVVAAVIYVNSKVTPVSLSKQVVKNLDSTSSLHSVDTISFEGTAGQKGINFDVALRAVDDNKVSTNPSLGYSERTVDITLMGKSTSQKNYIYVDGDTDTMYASTDGSSWYSQTAEGTVYSIRTQTMEAFFEAVADEELEAQLDAELEKGTTDADTGSYSSETAATEEPAVTAELAATEEPAVAAELAATEEPAVTDESAATDEPARTYKADEVYTLTAEVSGDLLKDMMTGMLTSIEGETSNRYDAVDWDSMTAQVTALVYKDSKLPARITVSCPELGGRIMRSSTGGSDSTSVTGRTFSVQVDLDGYDETEVNIPSEIRNEASALIGGTDEDAAAAATTETASTEIAPDEEP